MASKKVREVQTSGGGRRVGALPRWMVSPCPGELGRRSGCKERSKRRLRLKYGVAIGVRSRGLGTEIHNTVETVGAGGG